LNVIPDTVRLGGTARSFSPEIRSLLQTAIQDVAENTAKAYGCKIDFEWGRAIRQPSIMPNRRRVRLPLPAILLARIILLLIPNHLWALKILPLCWQEKPGAYIWLGAGPAKEGAMLHNANYDFNDEVLATGASYWAQLVESELPK
jgi:metal-dependent amidase/aminoacylase/carboxypeptidase family protein